MPAEVTADAAFVEGVLREHGGILFAFCLRFTGDRQRAEDAVQEVLVRAWRQIDSLELGERSLRPWLLTCARNLLTDVHRASAARPVLVHDEAALASAGSTENGIDRAVESWTMAEALQRLSDEHREVLVECFWMGRSVAEAAQVLGVPAGTVKSRTYYAMRALRSALTEMGVGR
ncbi:MAG: sigma-70 family RNA polymerase sigma factor [Nakamurella sp.]